MSIRRGYLWVAVLGDYYLEQTRPGAHDPDRWVPGEARLLPGARVLARSTTFGAARRHQRQARIAQSRPDVLMGAVGSHVRCQVAADCLRGAIWQVAGVDTCGRHLTVALGVMLDSERPDTGVARRCAWVYPRSLWDVRPAAPVTPPTLADLGRSELHTIARQRGLTLNARTTRLGLIRAIRDAG